MGFELSAIVSSPVSPQQKLALTLAARRRWPFLRLPLRDTHPERLVLGGIERTSYMLSDDESGTLAMILDQLLEAELAELSREFPTVALAWMHTNCFGGHCEDDGRVCRGGEVVAEGSSLRSLLAAVELESEGYFAGFERGYFGAQLDPRAFAACLGTVVGEGEGESWVREPAPSLPLDGPPGPPSLGELAAFRGEPRGLRALVSELLARAVGLTPIWGPRAEGHPLVFANHGGVIPVWFMPISEPVPSEPEAQHCLVAELLGDAAWLRGRRPGDPFTRPTHLKLVLPESVADPDALCRAVDGALAQVGGAERPQIGVLGPQELAQVGEASSALPEGSVVSSRESSTEDSGDAATNADEPRLPAALWTGRALDERRSGSALTALEQDVMAALDRGGDDALESLAVLADWLGRQAETRGHGEVLSMDLRVSSLAAADQVDEAAALRRKLRAARQGLWNSDERTLELIAEGGDAADRPRLDDWAPQLWVEWKGPWLVRLMVRSAWPVRFSEAPALHDRWDMYEKAMVPYQHLRRIFALPCARYLGPRRVTLLGSPVTPDLAGRNLERWSLRDLALVQESMPRTRFTDATLERCRMTDANLQQADLHGATLREIDLRGADLRGADLRGAELAGVDLRCADLRGARLEGLRASDLAITGARIQPEQRQLLSAAGISEADLELTAPVR